MTQVSLPQAGSGVGDSGPYTADDWAKFFEVAFTGDQAATQGVLRNYLNELEVTRSGITISIDTGAGFCYGHWLLNDTSVEITANACAGVETRWDRVVLVQNETAVAYNTNLLLPAAYAGGVPRNSCRIAILRGTCGSPGVLPALLTGPNIYMVELARYQMTGGSTGAITDYRDFCNFSSEIGADWIDNRTRRLFIPVMGGYLFTLTEENISVAYDDGSATAHAPNVSLPNDERSQGGATTAVPSDYLSGMTIKALIESPATGNIYGQTYAYWGECGGSYQSGSSTSGYIADSISGGSGYYNCLTPLSVAVPVGANENILNVTYRREGADPLDTLNERARLYGWIMEYTADS